MNGIRISARAALGVLLFMTVGAMTTARAAVDVAADDANIQYSGRFDFSDPKKPACDWPGCSILARFTGTAITVKISGGQNDFNVIVDGVWKSKLTVDGKTSQVAASGLTDGTHTLLLTKRTEGFQGVSVFAGFQLEDGKALAAPPPRPIRKIQFIGDSFTVGYGDEANVLSCPDRRPFDNNYVAYGPVTARAVDAEYSVQAISGIGMAHNYGDTVPMSARPLPSYFEQTLFGSAKPSWDMAKWIPDLIVVALGTNDFSTTVKPSEAQYTGAYADFLGKIRGWYPNAQILCMTYAVDSYQKKYVDSVVNRAIAKGDQKIHRVHMPTLASTDLGCDFHPNVSGQQKYSDALLPYVKQYLGIATGIAPGLDGGHGRNGRKRLRKAGPGTAGATETWRIPLRTAGTDGAFEAWTDATGRNLDLPGRL